ncbi:MAG: S41 family peptidase [Coprobacter fastidiosus]
MWEKSNLDQILAAFSSCDGIIIDVRDNSGGILTTVNRIASRFITEDRICGYIRHKSVRPMMLSPIFMQSG